MAGAQPSLPTSDIDTAYQGIAATSPTPQNVPTTMAIRPTPTIDFEHPLAGGIEANPQIGMFMGMLGGKGEPHDIPGLPQGELPREITGYAKRGAHQMAATKQPSKWEPRYEVLVKSKVPPGSKIKEVGQGRQTYQYDPDLAEVVQLNPEEPLISRPIARVKPGLTSELHKVLKPESDKMYRGMSHEEFENFQKTGEIKSTGEYNIADSQKGTTSWSKSPRQAESYANSFAPPMYRATFDRPAYVVVAKRAGPEHQKTGPWLPPEELSVTRPITKDDITEVWRARVASHGVGDYTLTENNGRYQLQFGSAPTADVVWERVR